MKLFIISLLVISTFSFAQDNYHADPAPFACSLDACLVDADGAQIGFYEAIDRDGFVYLKLSTNSSIFDINTNNLCFTGDPKNVSNILDGLIGNTNADFYNGGHINIIESSDIEVELDIVRKLIIYADDHEIVDLNKVISVKRCE